MNRLDEIILKCEAEADAKRERENKRSFRSICELRYHNDANIRKRTKDTLDTLRALGVDANQDCCFDLVVDRYRKSRVNGKPLLAETQIAFTSSEFVVTERLRGKVEWHWRVVSRERMPVDFDTGGLLEEMFALRRVPLDWSKNFCPSIQYLATPRDIMLDVSGLPRRAVRTAAGLNSQVFSTISYPFVWPGPSMRNPVTCNSSCVVERISDRIKFRHAYVNVHAVRKLEAFVKYENVS